ncbi:hypothetical protein MUN82_04000 [Hymenobacter aerilatus]|uniref:Uncharacterized protein n=1 Tax=Hymenobacter aerilatus TaxID=2932251 RepID=A0A8T9SVQ7_9BACT|nr:hypothetical protein [Hymenobacter aerilatus]UOR06262.1 hypothetical protein MUN82_04000 [Hymenobacter aerilatus]
MTSLPTASSSTQALSAPLPTPEHALLALVTSPGTISELARTENPDARMMLAELSVGLTPAVATSAPKLFQLNRQLGEATVVKLLVVILKSFVDSVKVPTKPDAADIIEMADTLAQTYTHDSIKDIVLALKDMRTQGTKFYQSLDPSTIYAGLNKYFEKKADFLENQHYDQKVMGQAAEAVALRTFSVSAGEVLDNIAARIPEDHPNRERLRRRLSLAKARAARNLISKEQHEKVQAEHRQMTTRPDRKDWGKKPNRNAA